MKALHRLHSTVQQAEQLPARWLRVHHPHLWNRVQQPNVQRVLLLSAVCIALLLDNMLYMVIVPIIPDYLRQVGAWHTHRLPSKLHAVTPTEQTAQSTLLPPHLPTIDNENVLYEIVNTSQLYSSSSLHVIHSNQTYLSPVSQPLFSSSSSSEKFSTPTPIARRLAAGSGRLVYEGEDSAIGLLFASKALVQLLVNPFSGALIDRLGAGQPMLFGLCVMFLSTAVFAAGRTYTLLFLARSLQGVGSAFADTGGFALLAARFNEPQEREQALGLALSFVSFGCLFAPPFGGLLYEFFGKELPFIVLSLLCLFDGAMVLAVIQPPDPDSIESDSPKVTSVVATSISTQKTDQNAEHLHLKWMPSTKSEHIQSNGIVCNNPIDSVVSLQKSRERADQLKEAYCPQYPPTTNPFLASSNNSAKSSSSSDLGSSGDFSEQSSPDQHVVKSHLIQSNLSANTDQERINSQCVSRTDQKPPSVWVNPLANSTLNQLPQNPFKQQPNDNASRPFKKPLQARLQKSYSLAGPPPGQKATPIYVLFCDPQIAVCSGALVMANVSLAFLEPTLSIWMVDNLRAEEWQLGLVWLPAFFPYVIGVYSTVKMNRRYPQHKYLLAIGGLCLTGVSCLFLPAVSSYAQLMLPISVLCFGVAIIDSAVFPTLGYIVDTRYVSVYGSIYAIADISYSLAYAFGPIVAGAIVTCLDFVWLNWIIALLTLGYCPLLLRLKSVQQYERIDSPEAPRHFQTETYQDAWTEKGSMHSTTAKGSVKRKANYSSATGSNFTSGEGKGWISN